MRSMVEGSGTGGASPLPLKRSCRSRSARFQWFHWSLGRCLLLETRLLIIVTAALRAMALPHRIAAVAIEADAIAGNNISCKHSTGTKIRGPGAGGAHQPIHTAIWTPTDHVNRRGACGRERTPYLENEDRIGIACEVESECSCQLSRRAKLIDARNKRGYCHPRYPETWPDKSISNGRIFRLLYAVRALPWRLPRAQ